MLKIFLPIILFSLISLHFAGYSQTIINWHKFTAKSVRNGVAEDSLYFFNVFYHKENNSINECSLTITELRNLNCKNNSGAYLENSRTFDKSNGLICNISKKENKFEHAIISYNDNVVSTSLEIGYDTATMTTTEFEGSTTYSFPNSNNIKINYIPLRDKKGYMDSSIKCGRISVKTLKTD
jgi:hypothetical protein